MFWIVLGITEVGVYFSRDGVLSMIPLDGIVRNVDIVEFVDSFIEVAGGIARCAAYR